MPPKTTEEALNEMSNKELGDVKVLLGEDDNFIAELVVTKLMASGCIPYRTDDGKDALDFATQYEPDVIILDLMLPTVQGEEVLKQLKTHDTLKRIPVIIFSNKDQQSDIDANIAAGAARFMVKSATDLNDLVAVVNELARVIIK